MMIKNVLLKKLIDFVNEYYFGIIVIIFKMCC